MSSADPLLQPFTLKRLVLRNRLMSSAHEPAYTEEGMPKERYRLYHSEKAKGGIGLTIPKDSKFLAILLKPIVRARFSVARFSDCSSA